MTLSNGPPFVANCQLTNTIVTIEIYQVASTANLVGG
jgi:hypothetical protein